MHYAATQTGKRDPSSTSDARLQPAADHSSVATVLLVVATCLALTGCVTRIWNEPLHDQSANDRFDFRQRLPENAEDLFIILAFSGGGTRAAAFSYGVLDALRQIDIDLNGKRRRLLDEVDVITSVSGGSYTAAYYGLFGDRLFDSFKEDFLYRDWQRQLIGLTLRPISLLSMSSPTTNRSDVVAAHLGRSLFEEQTFASMSRDGRPFVIINAADINNATTFSFIQQHFDFLCSDLSSYPVANAVMASAAVPGLFASMALRNYPDCQERQQGWVDEALVQDDFLDRRRSVAMALTRYADPDRMPTLRLVDGGVTDNLGLRGSMMSPVAHYGNVPDMAGAFSHEQLERVRNVLVVVANAQVYREQDWSVSGRRPGLIATVEASFDAALGILNTETIALAKQGFLAWQDRVNSMRSPELPRVKVHFSILTFDHIEDLAERKRFNALPTTFRLDEQDVDALVEKAGYLLRQSPEFNDFLSEM